MARVALLITLLLAGCGSAERAHREPTPRPVRSAGPDISIGDIERANGGTPTPKPTATRTPTPPSSARPPMTPAFIPFPASRKAEMAAYAQRHYGIDSYALEDPQVIVEHYTVTDTAAQAIDVFRPDVPDAELHELPGTCAHFVIDRDGTIYEVVPVTIMCRHTVGLNYTSIGIEHAGFSDAEVLGNAAEMRSSLALTRWLQCRFGITTANVIGHNESLTSPFHRENVAAMRTQTHEDFNRADMDVYRARLGSGDPCRTK